MHSVVKMIILLYNELPKNKLIMVKKRDLLDFYKNNNYTFIRCFVACWYSADRITRDI